MSYRDDVREVHKEARWTFFKLFPLLVVMIVALTAIGFSLRSLGLLGQTVVEREVFENSYQRSEGIKAQIAGDEAVIAEIEGKLTNPNLDSDVRYNLEAQLSAARLRINIAKRRL